MDFWRRRTSDADSGVRGGGGWDAWGDDYEDWGASDPVDAADGSASLFLPPLLPDPPPPPPWRECEPPE